MNIRYLAAGISALAVIASPAAAGDEVLFAQVPAWVVPADLEAAIAVKSDVALFDRQVRLENGTVTVFTDLGYLIETPQQLQQMGSVQMAWLPDKGDLTVNRLHIIRDGKVIDLLEQGVRPDVIRRERELERRSLNGMLTALTTVPDLRIGDVLRLSTTTTSRDQALMGEVQTLDNLVAKPARIGFGRYILSWPEGDTITWKTLGQVEEPQTTTAGGFKQVQFDIPIEEPEDMPDNAPGRFIVKPSIHAGSFTSWSDVAQTMAPHFATEGTVLAGGPIAAEVARIEAATDNPLERAALALQSVQDEISYLANGMDGGNYLPQSPQETWTLRYGDCKAKSLLLLAMLREMGTTADTVLVDTDNGDAVSISPPVPGAFNHMIVRAEIGGEEYWLDGTSSGSRLTTIHEVPNFSYALPLRADGADLMKMEQRWPETPDRTMRITYDMSRGVDLPVLFDIEVETTGVLAARMQPQAAETDRKRILGTANQYVGEIVEGVVYDASYGFDEKSGTAKLTARGMAFDIMEIDRGVATLTPDTASTNWSFTPDRARKEWRDIPYQVGGPVTYRQQTTYILPDGTIQSSVTGDKEVNTVIAGTRLHRKIAANDERVTIEDGSSLIPVEIAPADIAAAKQDMQRYASGDPIIRIKDPQRHWELEDREIARRAEVYGPALEALQSLEGVEGRIAILRSAINILARNYEDGLESMNVALEDEASAEHLISRADLNYEMGRLDDAIADARSAFDLQGDVAAASALAILLSRDGQAAEGLALLDDLGIGGDEAVSVTSIWSEISGAEGREAEGWERLEELMLDRPGDGSILNAQCWMAGLWSYRLTDAKEVCDRAVRETNYSAATLDSRALVKHRLGQTEEALADLNAALRKSPAQAGSRFLRGVIMLENGDEHGQTDIVQALRLSPGIARRYAQYGISPDS